MDGRRQWRHVRDNAARLSGYLLQLTRRRTVVFPGGEAVHARPRRRPRLVLRQLRLRLRWRPYDPEQLDVLFPATPATRAALAAAALAALAVPAAALAAAAFLAALASAALVRAHLQLRSHR